MKSKLYIKRADKYTLFFIIFILSLIVMYSKPLGISAIEECYGGFVIPDMEFGYTYEFIKDIFEHLGRDGLLHYSYYYIVDLFFIIGLIGTQFYFLKTYKSNNNLLNIFCGVFIVTRCIFDLLEDLLFEFMIKGLFTVNPILVNMASFFTKLKFISLGLWAFFFVLCIIFRDKKI